MKRCNIGLEAIRKVYSLDKGWKFESPNDPAGMINSRHGREYEIYDDSQWSIVDLPHDYLLSMPIEQKNGGAQAWRSGALGWYRKKIVLENIAEKNYVLQVDGAYRKAELWVNGKFVYIQHNGYFGFTPDITKFVREGENLIAIRIDCLDITNCRWYSGAGIYRHVKLIETANTRIAPSGVFVTTPEINDEQAKVRVRVELLGPIEHSAIEVAIKDKKGDIVARQNTSVASDVVESEVTVPKPLLWSLEIPNMYQALVTVYKNQKPVDDLVVPFGIRTIEYRKGKGFLLNGIPHKFKGANVHHDGGPMGAAVPESVWEARLIALKQMGCNSIGTAHNPPAPEFLDLCDQIGLLVNDEFADKWEPPHYVDFSADWEKDLTGFVKRDRNHPSVVMWSFGCENNEPGSEYFRQRLTMLAECVRALDLTRPFATSLDRGPDLPKEERGKKIVETSRPLDFVGCNYVDQWYDEILEYDKDALVLSTESYVYFSSQPDERFTLTEYNPWLNMKDDRVLGQFVWCGVDYLGEASHHWPNQGFTSGILDMIGNMKPAARLLESLWADHPVVSIAVYRQDPNSFQLNTILDQWEWPNVDQNWSALSGNTVDIVTYTNCEQVALLLNGKEVGRKTLDDYPNKIIKWQLPYQKGTLTAIGYNNGIEEASFSLSTPESPRKIELVPYKDSLIADGLDIAMVGIRLLDANGTLCADSNEVVSLQVTGQGKLERVGNADLNSHDSFFDDKVRVYQGYAMAYVRAGEAAGELRLTVSATGLDKASVTINVE